MSESERDEMRERDIRPDAEAAGADGGNSVVCPSVKLIPEVSRIAARRERKTRAMKIACAVLVPFCVIVIVFAWLLNARSLGIDGTGNTDSAYGTVLADIEGITQANPRIVDIAMLGAHDANTSSLSVSCGADDSVESPLLSAIFPISSGFQYRYAVTQTVSPYRLMMQGARFMHFKFARIDGVYRASHSVLGREFVFDILDVLRFLDEHPGEVVVLLFQCTNETVGDNADCMAFNEWLAGVRYDGKNLYDYMCYGTVDGMNLGFSGKGIDELRYNDVTENGAHAGVVMLQRFKPLYGEDEYSGYFYDMDKNALHEWHSRMGEEVLTESIDATCREVASDPANTGFLRVNRTQAAMSAASLGDIFRSIGAWSLLKFAEGYNVALLENESFEEWLKYMPVFQVDFLNSDEGDFNRRVNAKIRERNEQIVQILLADGATDEDIYR